MKPLPAEARIANITSKPDWNKHVALCKHCGDTGAVTAMLRRYGEDFIEELAPCPYCQLGYRLEHSHYGTEGYWQGREAYDIKPLYPNGTEVVNQTELRELLKDHLKVAEHTLRDAKNNQ